MIMRLCLKFQTFHDMMNKDSVLNMLKYIPVCYKKNVFYPGPDRPPHNDTVSSGWQRRRRTCESTHSVGPNHSKVRPLVQGPYLPKEHNSLGDINERLVVF